MSPGHEYNYTYDEAIAMYQKDLDNAISRRKVMLIACPFLTMFFISASVCVSLDDGVFTWSDGFRVFGVTVTWIASYWTTWRWTRVAITNAAVNLLQAQ